MKFGYTVIDCILRYNIMCHQKHDGPEVRSICTLRYNVGVIQDLVSLCRTKYWTAKYPTTEYYWVPSHDMTFHVEKPSGRDKASRTSPDPESMPSKEKQKPYRQADSFLAAVGRNFSIADSERHRPLEGTD